MKPDPVGIIGVGLVGGVIADRLAAGGFSVCGFDPADPANRNLELLPSSDDVFACCPIVVISLPDSDVVRSVLAKAPLASGPLIIDTTTGKPEDAIDNARILRAAGGEYIEATIAVMRAKGYEDYTWRGLPVGAQINGKISEITRHD